MAPYFSLTSYGQQNIFLVLEFYAFIHEHNKKYSKHSSESKAMLNAGLEPLSLFTVVVCSSSVGFCTDPKNPPARSDLKENFFKTYIKLYWESHFETKIC